MYWNGLELAHSSPWKSSGTYGAVRSSALCPAETDQVGKPFANRSIADLVVILGETDEVVAR